jgi:PhnB protein
MQTCSITPYLYFSGTCEAALKFYERALGAQILQVMKFRESPDPVPEGILQEGFEDKVMHASLMVNGAMLMASDGCNDQAKFGGFSLSLVAPDEATATRFFNALSEGGNVMMPLGPTFWSPCFGMVTDAFGIQWMVMILSAQ